MSKKVWDDLPEYFDVSIEMFIWEHEPRSTGSNHIWRHGLITAVMEDDELFRRFGAFVTKAEDDRVKTLLRLLEDEKLDSETRYGLEQEVNKRLDEIWQETRNEAKK
jgi:hypothetical protein